MSTQAHSTMFNPFDGLLLASSMAVSATYAVVGAGSSLVASVCAAAVTGVFVLIAKGIELWWKSRTDNRVRELEQQLLYEQRRNFPN